MILELVVRLPLSAALIATLACSPHPPAREGSAGSGPRAPGTVHRVDAGASGMVAQVRWAYSPDSSALIAVEDWASIEAEPFFDGFRLASERTGRIVGRDSVWDAMPSPDWRHAAFGAALVARAGESESLPTARLEEAAHALGVSPAEARASRFSASGMAVMAGWSRLGIVDLGSGQTRMLGSLTGWRVRWSPDGSRIIAGLGPDRAYDDAAPAAWVTLTPDGDSSASIIGTAPDTATMAWITGPTLDVSVAPDSTPVTIRRDGHAITSRQDTIRLDGAIVGRGVALAATRGGCYVLALVPVDSAESYAPGWRAGIYDLGCTPARHP